MTAPGVKLRYAGLDEGAAVARLEVASSGGRVIEDRTAYWQSEILSPTDVVVAGDGADIVGFVACGQERNTVADEIESGGHPEMEPPHGGREPPFEIYSLHVDPTRRRRRVGLGLFGAACSLAQRAGAGEIAVWVDANDGPARLFFEWAGLKADLLRAARPGPETDSREIRYCATLDPMPDPPGKADWRLLQPVVKESEPDSWPARVVVGAALILTLGLMVLWLSPGLRERLAARDSQRQMLDSPVDQARRAAERELQVLLRPLDHTGAIGADRSARQWRLGLAYGRLALIEERAGDLRKRDRYFDFAKRALKEGGVRNPTENYIREQLKVTPPRNR
jgi:ribosomal protein S18 acetylase RimI-like enzyme